ncbi:hypothetical protein B0H13DRAFT_2360224 [Mycena leptocephala]|nr:hypothetical protein B0H13DRAFT_2360224 [Mycena leptocephala]
MAPQPVIEILEGKEIPPFHPEDWIGKNIEYPSSPPPELEAYCTQQLSIPPLVTRSFPDDSLSVAEFLRVQLPGKSHALVFPAASTCFSDSVPTTSATDVVTYLRNGTLPPAKLVASLKVEAPQAILDGKQSVLDSRYPNIRLSLWIIEAWDWLGKMIQAQGEWKMASDWIAKRRSALPAAERSAEIFSSLGWNAPLEALPRDTTCSSFARMISDRMVSDGGLDMMIRSLQRRISEDPLTASKVLLVQRPFIHEILKATTADQYKEEKKKGLLLRIEKKLKEADMAELWFAVLWREQKHWLPFKCDFRELTLSYGDPLKMDGKPHIIIQKTLWWLRARFNTRFRCTGDTLTCGNQNDQISCGFIAVNTIASNVLGDALWTQSNKVHDRVNWRGPPVPHCASSFTTSRSPAICPGSLDILPVISVSDGALFKTLNRRAADIAAAVKSLTARKKKNGGGGKGKKNSGDPVLDSDDEMSDFPESIM